VKHNNEYDRHTHSDEKTDKTYRGRTGFGCMLTNIFRFVWLILLAGERN